MVGGGRDWPPAASETTRIDSLMSSAVAILASAHQLTQAASSLRSRRWCRARRRRWPRPGAASGRRRRPGRRGGRAPAPGADTACGSPVIERVQGSAMRTTDYSRSLPLVRCAVAYRDICRTFLMRYWSHLSGFRLRRE